MLVAVSGRKVSGVRPVAGRVTRQSPVRKSLQYRWRAGLKAVFAKGDALDLW